MDRRIAIINRLCERDSKFADFFLVHPSPSDSDPSHTSHWDVPEFLWKLYERQIESEYHCVVAN
jgi:hypothetical protein